MKQTIRLTESQFKKVITETVKKVLREDNFYQLDPDYDPAFDYEESDNENTLNNRSVHLYVVLSYYDPHARDPYFSGSWEKCIEYITKNGPSSYSIVDEDAF